MARRGAVRKREQSEQESRPIRWRKYIYLLLIVCEDGKTEPYYFENFKKSFPEQSVFLKAVGTGRNARGVVEQAMLEREKLATESNKDVDEVWAVFDKDDADKVPANHRRFLDAFTIAEHQNIQVAYSNEAFELWLLLHFIDVVSTEPIPRAEINLRLEKQIIIFSKKIYLYTHGNISIVDKVMRYGNENEALERAIRLLAAQRGIHPIDANPSTTIHILVRRLRELIAYYSYQP